MRALHRGIGLGLGAVAVVVMTGCGGSTPPAPAPAASSVPAPAPSSQTPSSPAPSSQAPSTQTSEPSGSDSAKPAKSDIVAGLAKFYVSSQALDTTKAKNFATCMVDQMYDKAKASSLIAMRDGDPTKLDKGDVGLLAESAVKCEPALK